MVAVNKPESSAWSHLACRTAEGMLEAIQALSCVVASTVDDDEKGPVVAKYQTMVTTLVLLGLLDNLRYMASPELQVLPLTDEQRSSITDELLGIVNKWDGQKVGGG